ncbi:MAG: PD-(D/E)XK nuclease family protein [Planctomycetia bacterium]|nr:PD-(D/E)XK nuclease family protein [Planctomycetia bacterium]
MTTSITRVFLSWDRPLLETAVSWLIARYGSTSELDLSRVSIVVPGRRVGRRLLELLVLASESAKTRLVPPFIETLGALPETLYPLQKPLANDLVQQLTWAKVLREMDRSVLGRIVPQPPAKEDALAWWSLGSLMWQQHRELAADGCNFQSVLECGRAMTGFGEAARWQALVKAQNTYHESMDGLNLWDMQTSRLVAIEKREPQTDRDLILLGTADINQVTRGVLDLVADRVTALIAAPEARASWFDAYGCLVPTMWAEAPIDVPAEQIRLCEGPADQASQVARELASFDGRYRTDEVVIGLADQNLGPFIERELSTHSVTTRWIEGSRLADSGPCRLLAVVADVLERGRIEDFAALMRHHDFGDWLARRGRDASAIDLATLDEAFRLHLPISAETLQEILDAPSSDATMKLAAKKRSRQKALASLPANVTEQEAPTTPQLSASIRELLQATHELLAPLKRADRKLNEWAEPLLTWLRTVYGERVVDDSTNEGRIMTSALRRLNEIIDEIAVVPDSVAPVVSAADAIRCAIKRTTADFVPPETIDNAIELLGWLELPLDDTPAAIVTSFNEGFVPTSLNSDLFLPNELRQRLGLNDNTRRFARDAYAVTLLQHARRDVVWLIGRRDAEGNPLIPSRLLFAVDEKELPQRVLQFLERDQHSVTSTPQASNDDTNPTELVSVEKGLCTTSDLVGTNDGVVQKPGFHRDPTSAKLGDVCVNNPSTEDHVGFVIPHPGQIAASLEMTELLQPARELTLNVTEFRSYLACPYRYFLRHVLKLQTLDDDAVELDALSFGNVLHEVLRKFGQSDLRDSADAEKLRKWLCQLLIEVADEQFGTRRRAAVNVQLKQLESRLEVFARWQATWRRDGWTIAYAEVSVRPSVDVSKMGNNADQTDVANKPAFTVDGIPVWLHGRIDRIDHNVVTDEWAIFDYKSGDKGASPEETHRKRKSEWVDLQLPLYRHLAHVFSLSQEPRLGYINLPKDLGGVGASFAEWSRDELSDADASAMRVARCVARREFWPPTDPPPSSLQEFNDICQVKVFGGGI